MVFYKIEKEKKVPFLRYPFKDMDVGNSFFVPLNGRLSCNVASSIINSSSYYKKRYNKNDFRFITRHIKDEDGVRCWRVE